MQSDRRSMPSALYEPRRAAEPYRKTAFTAECLGWALLFSVGVLALCAVLVAASGVLAP